MKDKLTPAESSDIVTGLPRGIVAAVQAGYLDTVSSSLWDALQIDTSKRVPRRVGRTEEQTGVEGHGQYEYGYACNGCGVMSRNEDDPCPRCDK